MINGLKVNPTTGNLQIEKSDNIYEAIATFISLWLKVEFHVRLTPWQHICY